MEDLKINVAPVLRWQRAMEALEARDAADTGGVRQGIEDPLRLAVGYLEALVSAALDTRIDELDAAATARTLLAEELLLILTGSNEVEAVRAWLRAR